MKSSASSQNELNKRYLSLLGNVDGRAEQVRKLTTFLSSKTNWPKALVSRKGDVSLIEHSICVAEILLKMAEAVGGRSSRESMVICGLFHDISKLGCFIGDEFYPRFLKSGSSHVYNEKIAEVALGARSLYMISKFISLNEEETQAIVSSEGLYNYVNEYMKYKETSLALLLHWSDYWVSHVVEKPGKWEFDGRPWEL